MNPLKIIFRYNKIQEALCRSYQYQVEYFTISSLYNRNEISEEVYQEIRPKNAKIARAHGLPKVHKSFDRVPSFRPIIDTIGFTHYNVGKYITKLLNPLTQNEYSLKDTFDAAEPIKKIPKEQIRN